jgi:hypothetical protein
MKVLSRPASRPACDPIDLGQGRIYYLTQPQLVRVNKEAIRLGFSRTLVEKKIAKLPSHFKLPILSAWNHTSREGWKNIRLELLIGPDSKHLDCCCLDVTHDAWAKMKKKWAPAALYQG